MKDNSIDKQLIEEINSIESSKNKYFTLGFILGIVPFLLIILVLNIFVTKNISILKYTLLVASLITATINAFFLRFTTYNRLIEFFNLKYNLDYNKIKKDF
jgi:hypothetical protein